MKSFMNSRTLRSLSTRARIAGVIVAVAFAGLFMAACKDNGPRFVQSIVVSPTTATIAVNTTQQFTLVATDNEGNVVTVTPTWSIVSGGGTISSTGLFTAGRTPGTTIISVTCSGVTVTATVTVTAGPLLTIAVLPQTTTLAPGATQQFTAVGRDAFGNVVAITPVWTVRAPNTGTINASTGLFTAGTTTGSFPNTVRASVGAIFDEADVIVIAGPLLTIAVLPQTTTLVPGATQQFTAVGRDAFGNVVPITPVWTVPNPPGTINASTGLFTAGSTIGSFPNTVRATVGTIFDEADVIVILPPAPPAVAGFTVLGRQAVTCTNGNITGEVGTLQAAPTGSITLTSCPITGGTAQVGTPASIAAFNNFVTTYNSLATTPCGVVLTGTLAGVTLAPGVYCFNAAAAPTGVLTLQGTSTDRWLFKIGTSGTGALTPGAFTVTMAGGALPCNVTWWVKQGATMTDSFFKGSVLTGAAITVIRGNFNGNAWAGADGAVAGDVTITGPLTPPGVTGCP